MDETDIKTFADITLSNRRLVQRGKIGGVKSLSSIPLSSYASSKMESVSKPYFVVLSALCLIGALVIVLTASNFSPQLLTSVDLFLGIENVAVSGLLLLLSVFFLLLFVKTLTAKITIESTGGQTISAEVSGKRDSIENFVDSIDEQVYLFLKAMNNNNTRHSAPQAEPVVQKFKSTALSDPKQEITVTSSADSKNKQAL